MLPWPELKIPLYTPTTLGPWALRMCEKLPQLGYFQDRREDADLFILFRNEVSWMSTAWDELESQAPHLAAANGHVVVMGAGMGVVLYNILLKPQVTQVTLVERDPLVVELLRKMTNLDEWVGIEKLQIVFADAFDYRPSAPVDFLYVDIWADPGDPQALLHTQQIQQQVQAKAVGWWTQEIEFLFWLEKNGHGTAATQALYCAWANEIGLPMIEQQNPAYPDCIVQVARSYCYQTVCQRLAQQTHA